MKRKDKPYKGMKSLILSLKTFCETRVVIGSISLKKLLQLFAGMLSYFWSHCILFDDGAPRDEFLATNFQMDSSDLSRMLKYYLVVTRAP